MEVVRHASMKRSKLGAENFVFPARAAGKFASAFSQSASEYETPSFTLKICMGNTGTSPFPSPRAVAARSSRITILPSGDVSVP